MAKSKNSSSQQENSLNIEEIVSQLKAKRNQIDHAIGALEELSPNGATDAPQRQAKIGRQKRGGLTAAGRKRLSEMMKKRWAERRKKVSAKR